jgi:aryl-alcohol dehydrogenase-like predicted oxidoreductase
VKDRRLVTPYRPDGSTGSEGGVTLGERRLGSGGLVVSELGLGCVGMSALYGPRDRDESVATLQRALDLGMTLIDTSDVYGVGHNEELLGAALGGRWGEAVLATKFGAVRHPDGTGYATNGRPEHVMAACEASLRRLGADHIDLYYQHRMDPDTPIEDTVGAMAGLVEAGKVRFLGLSECSTATLRRAHAVHPISAVQVEYSLFARWPEAELLPVCRELGVGLVAYSPLGRGILSGTVGDTAALAETDYRRVDPRYDAENLAHNLQLVAALRQVADERGCTPGQLALAWLLQRSDDVVPIPGTARRRHLEENLGAADVELSADDLARIDDLAAPQRVAGDRYPPAELARLNL